MTLNELWAELAARGIKLALDDGGLRIRAPQGALDDELKAAIASRKPEILRQLETRATAEAADAPIGRLSAEAGEVPCAHVQHGLWFVERLQGADAPAYNMPGAFQLRGAIDVGALRSSFETLVERHASLRTRFAERDGEPMQILESSAAVPIPVEPVSEDALREQVRAEALRPFELSRAPLLRVRLLRLDADDHVLLVTLHHLVADGWSLAVLIDELAHCYRAYCQGATPALEPLPIQYADYACWQRQAPQAQAIERGLVYWREALAGLPPAIDLPTDRPRPAVRRFAGASIPLHIPAELTDRLRRYSRERGATLYMILLSALQVLLWRYSGQSDIAVGSPVANRPRRELEALVGCFVNTVVLRSTIDPALTLDDFLDLVKDTTLAAYAHQHVPFDRVVEALSPERSLAHHPLFQVMLVLQNAPRRALELPGALLDELDYQSEVARFDLTVALHESGDGLNGIVEFDRDLFDAATIERLACHFRVLLEGMVADPTRSVGELPFLTETERCEVLANAAGPVRDCDATGGIHALFETQVRQRPEAMAISAGARSLNYAELDERASALAERLGARGIGRGDRVALLLPRGAGYCVAVLATLKAGAAFVPIDTAYPAQRMRYMVEDAAPALVLTDGDAPGGLPAPCASLDALLAEPHGRSQEPANISADVADDDPAYVIYTSGSTGQPKGVVVAHGGLINVIADQMHFTGVGPDDRVLQFASTTFDVSVKETFLALGSGATLVPAADDSGAGAVEALPELMAEEGVTLACLPAAVLPYLSPERLPDLRVLYTGAEAVSGTEARRWTAGRRLINAYGPTEATIMATAHECAHAGEEAPPVGRPLANTKTYVLADDGALLPRHVTGEICIAGPGVALGYWKRPELTAERFVADPHDSHGPRMYRTGDLGRWRADGQLEFIGRKDDQVKVAGYRVELGEIEAAARVGGSVDEAVALVADQGDGARRLALFYSGAQAPEPSRLREHLAERLPAHMVPAVVTATDAWPLTGNNKIDKSALLERLQSMPAEAPSAGRALTDGEREIADIWRDVLGAVELTPDSHFFGVGGSSLLAMQVLARLEARNDVRVSARDFLAEPTVARLAKLAAAGEASAYPPLEPAPPGTAPRLSLGQQRLWFMQRMTQGEALHNMTGGMRIRGTLDVAALEASFQTLIERHRVLRTQVLERAGEPCVSQRAPEGWALSRRDLNGLAESARETQVSERIAEAARTDFDLANEWPIRAELLQVSADEHVLVVCLHHLVFDGWSVGLMAKELAALYGERVGHGPPMPEPPALQFDDFAHWQHCLGQTANYDRQLAYWRDRLAGVGEPLSLPVDRPRDAVASYAGDEADIEIDRRLRGALDGLARSAEASLFMVLLAGFKTVLAKLNDAEDVVVGIANAGRHVGGTEDMLGFFVNTLAIRSSAEPARGFDRYLAEVRSRVAEALDHQDVPFDRVVSAVNPQARGEHGLFRVFFNMLNLPDASFELPGVECEYFAANEAAAKFDLTVYVTDHGDRLTARTRYNRALLERERVVELLRQFRGLLAQTAAAPATVLAELSLRTPEAERRLPWPDAALAAPWQGGVLAHFERQVAQQPQAQAVVRREHCLSYAELSTVADAWAWALYESGVKAGDTVAVHTGRRIELVAGLLAVLKAGARFSVLDPAYPATRLVEQLRLIKPRALISTGAATPLPEAIEEAIGMLGAPALELGLDAGADTATRQCSVAVATPAAEDIAYVAFTSGSIGEPKGVLGTHVGLERAIHTWRDTLVPGPGDRFSLLSGLAHDPLHRDVFLALASGAAVAVPDDDDIAPGRLGHWLDEMAISVANVTPALLDWLSPASDSDTGLPRLRAILCVGERLSAKAVQRVATLAPSARVFNCYGTTETQQSIAVHEVEVDRDTQGTSVPLGAGAAHTQLLVLDRNQRAAGIGEPGEIWLRSHALASGYLNGEDEGFWAESGEHAARRYRTGDIGRYRPDGLVSLEGRGDRQLNVRGFRVEPAEIERVLLEQPGVRAAHVCMTEQAAGLPILAAYVVANGDARTSQHWRAALRERLPAHMVPAALQTLAQLPLTPNGKVDERRLPIPQLEQALAADSLPDDPIVQQLAAIWQEVLGVEAAGPHDDFFALGGHSLLAARVLARVGERFGAQLGLREVFRAPRLIDFAERVRAMESSLPVTVSQAPTASSAEAPLSFGQHRLWVLEQVSGVEGRYNMAGAYRLRGRLDRNALEGSLQAIVARHASLRTRFVEHQGEPVQRVESSTAMELAIEPVDEAQLTERLGTEAGKPFDLTQAPLLRARLFRLAADEHVLAVTLHHIVADGWSLGILVDELTTLYAAQVSGEQASLPPLPAQYTDYARWQRSQLDEAALQRQLDYWRRTLADLPPLSTLPTDRRRPPVQQFTGGTVDFMLPAAVVEELRTVGRERGATLFMVLLAALQVLLWRHSGQTDVAVGSPVANRPRPEWEGLIGFFVNTVVLRGRIDRDQSFTDFLAKTAETVLSAHEHQHAPFEQVVEAIQPVRSPAYHPLFQVMLALQSAPRRELHLPELALETLPPPSPGARFDLSLVLRETEEGLSGAIEYDSALFESRTMAGFATQLRALLEGIGAWPERALSELPVMDAEQHRELLAMGHGPGARTVAGSRIHAMVEAQAARAPSRIAIRQDGHELTYAQLQRRANGLAHWLRARGIGAGDRVALCVERRPERFIALLGILEAGAAYVPIDPDYPEVRRRVILDDAAPVLALSDDSAAGLPVASEHLDTALADAGEQSSPPAAEAAEAAYVIYTSGSTGKPKGVVIDHRGLCHVIVDQIGFSQVGPEDRVLQFASVGFDVSVKETFLALASGATLVLPPREPAEDWAAQLQALLERERVSLAIVLPAVLGLLDPERLPALRLVYTGAEAVSAAQARRWAQRRRFVNAYGPSEATIMASAYECRGDEIEPPPLGTPIADTALYVLDEQGRLLPPGAIGELCIAGPGVSRGYLDRPELTATRFVDDAINFPGERVYRTGDLARWRADGKLEWIGRGDDQVKLRGFRIELGDVAEVLRAHPGVTEAVASVDDSRGQRRLLAYYVGRATIEELREHARNSLPGYMVPSAIAQLSELPLTANNKIDRTRLPAIEAETAPTAQPPRSPVERALARVWESVLGVASVRVDDNFFELGGDSILAIQAVSGARAEGIHCTAKQIFEEQSIAALAPLVQSTRDAGARDRYAGPVPLTPIQQWLLERVGRHCQRFNQAVLLTVDRDLTATRLRDALRALVARHDMLRARYGHDGGHWHQWVVADIDEAFGLEHVDLHAEHATRGAAAIETFCEAMHDTLDLGRGPLLRAALLELGDAGRRLALVAHHLIVDGVSWRILLEDLVNCCAGGEPLPPLAGYVDWAEQVHALADDPYWLAQRDFWRRQLADVESLPRERDGENLAGSTAVVSVELSVAETESLLTGTEPVQALLLTPLVETVGEWLGRSAVTVSLESHGRHAFEEQVDLSRTVGWCTSLYPVRLEVTDSATPAERLRAVERQLRAVPHEGIGYGVWRYLAGGAREALPEPEVVFNYLGQLDRGLSSGPFGLAPESTGRPFHPDQPRTQVLSVNAAVRDERLRVNWLYSENLHRRATIERLAADYLQHLRELLEHRGERTTGDYSPTDFPEAELDQSQLDDLLANIDA